MGAIAKLVAASAVVAGLVGCGSNTSAKSQSGVTYASPAGVSIAADDRTLSASVTWGGCASEPEIVVGSQDAAKVVIEIKNVSNQQPGRVCPDFLRNGRVSVELKAPLDGRQLIDGVTGATIPVR